MTRPGTILQGGRSKAYRPLPAARRREALAAGIEAFERGDFFLAHELLEPAWMGARDPAERELHQGLIKLAAAFVHDVRGNPAGVSKNLAGARQRLLTARELNAPGGLDLDALVAEIERLESQLADDPSAPLEPPTLTRSKA